MLCAAMLLAAAQTSAPPPFSFKTEDELIKALYEVISGHAGQPRNWDRFRSLFGPKGTLSVLVKGKVVVMTPDDYVKGAGPYFEKNAFYEKESGRKVIKSGSLRLVASDYESRKDPKEKPFEKGTNTLQLYFDGAGWHIQSLLWEAAG